MIIWQYPRFFPMTNSYFCELFFLKFMFIFFLYKVIDIMWLASQSHFHLSFIFIEMNFYSLLFLCDVCNEVHERIK